MARELRPQVLALGNERRPMGASPHESWNGPYEHDGCSIYTILNLVVQQSRYRPTKFHTSGITYKDAIKSSPLFYDRSQ